MKPLSPFGANDRQGQCRLIGQWLMLLLSIIACKDGVKMRLQILHGWLRGSAVLLLTETAFLAQCTGKAAVYWTVLFHAFQSYVSACLTLQNLPEVPGAAHGMHATHPSAYTAPVNSPSYTATSATTAAAAAGTAAASLAAAAAGAHLGNGSVIGGSGGGGGGSGGTPLGPATLQAARTPALHAESFAGGNELDSEGEEDDEEESEGDEELTNDDLPGK